MPQSFGTGYLLAQGNGTHFELMRRHTWEVQIDQFDTVLTAQSVAFGSIELDAGEVYHFNERVKFAKMPNPTDITIDLLDPITPTLVQELWTWYKQQYDPNTGRMGYASTYKRQGQIFMYDVQGNLIRTWSAGGLWQKHAPTPSEALDYSSQDPVKLALMLSCDRLTLDALVTGQAV
jgi:hypothetical protein